MCMGCLEIKAQWTMASSERANCKPLSPLLLLFQMIPSESLPPLFPFVRFLPLLLFLLVPFQGLPVFGTMAGNRHAKAVEMVMVVATMVIIDIAVHDHRSNSIISYQS